MIDLPSGQIRILQALIAEHLPDAEIWGIGSRVEGTAKPSFQKKVADHHVVLFSPKSEPEIDERIVGLPQKENEAQPQQRKEKQV